MFCSNCGYKLEEEAHFCSKCGKKVASAPSDHVGTFVEPNDSVGTFTDHRDGRVYKTAKIGKQVWMTENLAYDVPGSKCYKGDPENFEKYGLLYDWKTAMNACPPGWHLPSKEEWQELVDFAGGKEIAGNKLKAKNGWNHKEGKSGNGTDDFGFSALPGGSGVSDGSFSYVGDFGYWWTATENNSNYAYYWYICHTSTYVDSYSFGKASLYSVRCVQD